MASNVDGLAERIAHNLEVWSKDLEDGIRSDIDEVAKEGLSTLKSTSPVRTGRYASGWRIAKRKDARVLHNEHYQLTHLLEKGHLTRSGTRTKKQPHIAPVEEELVAEITKRIEARIGS